MKNMLPQEFIALFDPKECHKELGEDHACPNCGSRKHLVVMVGAWAKLSDEGTEIDNSDHEWDLNSQMVCRKCDTEGQAKDFHIQGLDEAIARHLATNPPVL
jgi:rubredoxin